MLTGPVTPTIAITQSVRQHRKGRYRPQDCKQRPWEVHPGNHLFGSSSNTYIGTPDPAGKVGMTHRSFITSPQRLARPGTSVCPAESRLHRDAAYARPELTPRCTPGE